MAEVNAVVYEGWLEKCNISNSDSKKNLLRKKSTSSWKKFYFILRKERDETREYSVLAFYEKKPTTAQDGSKLKGITKLWPHYKVEKCFPVKGKEYIFAVTTDQEKYQLNADGQSTMDTWVFYLQMQTTLRHDLPGSCFIVKAVDSDEHRRIGSFGSNCLLHISPWGITCALQLSRSLIGQWPLKCIRSFESSDDGRFTFEAGRCSPMGEGEYTFCTQKDQDNAMYDLIDNYTTNSSPNQRQGQSSSGSKKDGRKEIDEITEEYDCLRLATFGLLPSQKAMEGAAVSASIDVPSTRSTARKRPPLTKQPSTDESAPEDRDGAGYMLPASEARKLQRSQSEQQPVEHSQQLIRSKSEFCHPKDEKGAYLDMSQSNLHTSSREDETWWSMSGEFKQEYETVGPETAEDIARRMSQTKPAEIPKREQISTKKTTAKQKRFSTNPYEDMVSPPSTYENAHQPPRISYENTPLLKPSPSLRSTAYENEAFVSSPSSLTQSLPKRFQIKENVSEQTFIEAAAADTGSVEYSQIKISSQKGMRRTGPPPYLELEEDETTVEPAALSPRLARSASYDNLIAKLSLSPSLDIKSAEIVQQMPEWLINRRLPAPPPGTINLHCVHSYLDIDVKGNRDKTKVGVEQKLQQQRRRHNYEDIDEDGYEFMQRTLKRSQSDSNLLDDTAAPPPIPSTPRPSQKNKHTEVNQNGQSEEAADKRKRKSSKPKSRPVSDQCDTPQEEASARAPADLTKLKSPTGMKNIRTSKKTRTFTKASPETEVPVVVTTNVTEI
ncbi:uncharacterized protein LOC144441216 [Glandiceps talaboti]